MSPPRSPDELARSDRVFHASGAMLVATLARPGRACPCKEKEVTKGGGRQASGQGDVS